MSRNIKCFPSFISFYFLLNSLQTFFSFLSLCIPHRVFFLSLSPVFLSLAQTTFFLNPCSNLAFISNPLSGSLNHARSLLKNHDSKATDLCISRDGSPNTSQVRPLL